MDVAIVGLREIPSDSQFLDTLAEAPSNAIIVLEDFDHYGDSDDGSGVTLAGMLNALDGIQGQSGSMVFMTCNDITKIPPPLLRPGRMDIKIKIDYADRQQIEEMFVKFFGYDPDTLEPVFQNDENNDIDTLKRRFADLIPENKVTTAELESYFIAQWVEADIDKPEDGIFERIFAGVPEFLEKIEQDREQARLHYNEKPESDGDAKNSNDDAKNSDGGDHTEKDEAADSSAKPDETQQRHDDPPTPPNTDTEEQKTSTGDRVNLWHIPWTFLCKRI